MAKRSHVRNERCLIPFLRCDWDLPVTFFLNQSILFIVSAMSSAGKRSNTISTSLCNAIATYSWQYGIWYQVSCVVLISVPVTIVLEALVLGACQPCSPSTQGVPLPMLVVEGSLQSTIWLLKVCGVDYADARPGIEVFRAFQVLVGACLIKQRSIPVSGTFFFAAIWEWINTLSHPHYARVGDEHGEFFAGRSQVLHAIMVSFCTCTAAVLLPW